MGDRRALTAGSLIHAHIHPGRHEKRQERSLLAGFWIFDRQPERRSGVVALQLGFIRQLFGVGIVGPVGGDPDPRLDVVALLPGDDDLLKSSGKPQFGRLCIQLMRRNLRDFRPAAISAHFPAHFVEKGGQRHTAVIGAGGWGSCLIDNGPHDHECDDEQ